MHAAPAFGRLSRKDSAELNALTSKPDALRYCDIAERTRSSSSTMNTFGITTDLRKRRPLRIGTPTRCFSFPAVSRRQEAAKSHPRVALFSAVSCPSCAWTMDLHNANPSPSPVALVVTNGSNTEPS